MQFQTKFRFVVDNFFFIQKLTQLIWEIARLGYFFKHRLKQQQQEDNKTGRIIKNGQKNK